MSDAPKILKGLNAETIAVAQGYWSEAGGPFYEYIRRDSIDTNALAFELWGDREVDDLQRILDKALGDEDGDSPYITSNAVKYVPACTGDPDTAEPITENQGQLGPPRYYSEGNRLDSIDVEALEIAIADAAADFLANELRRMKVTPKVVERTPYCMRCKARRILGKALGDEDVENS